MQLHDFLSLLNGVKPCNGYHTAFCPAHDDHVRSFSVREWENSKGKKVIQVKCYAGCTKEQICEALNITWKDLYIDNKSIGLSGSHLQEKEDEPYQATQEEKLERARWIYNDCSRQAQINEILAWLNTPKRNFGMYAQKAAQLLVASTRMNYYQGQQHLVFPIYNAVGNLTAIQTIGLPDSQPKKIQGILEGIFPIDCHSEIVFGVESVANAAALSAIGYSTAVLFGANNTKNIEVIKKRFPGKKTVLWFDKSDSGQIEQIQLEAMKTHQVHGIFWER